MAPDDLDTLGERARLASRAVARSSTATRNRVLSAAAELIEERTDVLLAANAIDLARAADTDQPASVVDRLRLSESRLASMSAGLRQVVALPDPVGEVVAGWVRPNGLRITEVRVPLGVVGVIYENRPNVTVDAAGLCLKAGNVAFLRGSAGAASSNRALVEVLRDACEDGGLPVDSVIGVADSSRDTAIAFMRLRGVLDCLIPRGGPSLIGAVVDNATVPYVIDGDGNCHVYVDESADLAMAAAIVVNGKTQRPSVCNATESLLVHEAVAERFLSSLAPALDGVELRGDERTCRILGSERASPAADDDWGREYLDLILSVRVVAGLDQAIEHIRRYGSGHTEAIVTSDLGAARRFQAEVDAAAVVVNASTRFTDGEEWGLGAEIGISTQKLHARGPMGLRALTCSKYLVDGAGHVR